MFTDRLFAAIRLLFGQSRSIRLPMATTVASDATDPALTDVLATGHSQSFHDALETAREKLRTMDLTAFWLQTVGDGSPVAAGPGDAIERRTPHQVARVIGYDDTIDYQHIVHSARQLFAHHLGLCTRQTDASESIHADLETVLTQSTAYATQLYDPILDEEYHFPEATAFAATREKALSLLDTDEMSYFWLQAVCDRDDATVVTVFGDRGETPSNPSRSWIDHPIEYVAGSPISLDRETKLALRMQCLAQQQFVGAKIANLSLETFGEQARTMAAEQFYVHDRI